MFLKVLEGYIAIWQNTYHWRLFRRASQCICLLVDVCLDPIDLREPREVTRGRLTVEYDDIMDVREDVTVSTG